MTILAKIGFCRQKLFLPVRFLPQKKTVFSTFRQKPANPGSNIDDVNTNQKLISNTQLVSNST